MRTVDLRGPGSALRAEPAGAGARWTHEDDGRGLGVPPWGPGTADDVVRELADREGVSTPEDAEHRPDGSVRCTAAGPAIPLLAVLREDPAAAPVSSLLERLRRFSAGLQDLPGRTDVPAVARHRLERAAGLAAELGHREAARTFREASETWERSAGGPAIGGMSLLLTGWDGAGVFLPAANRLTRAPAGFDVGWLLGELASAGAAVLPGLRHWQEALWSGARGPAEIVDALPEDEAWAARLRLALHGVEILTTAGLPPVMRGVARKDLRAAGLAVGPDDDPSAP